MKGTSIINAQFATAQWESLKAEAKGAKWFDECDWSFEYEGKGDSRLILHFKHRTGVEGSFRLTRFGKQDETGWRLKVGDRWMEGCPYRPLYSMVKSTPMFIAIGFKDELKKSKRGEDYWMGMSNAG